MTTGLAAPTPVTPAPPGPRAWIPIAIRGAVIGVAVVIALILMWVPSAACVSTAFFACLGTAIVTIFLMPIVAFFVAWAAGAAVRLPRPWLLALIGPVASYGALRVGDVTLNSWRASLILSCVLVALAYVVLALLLHEGTALLPRAIGIAVLAATLVVPGLVADHRAQRDQARALEALGVPLLLAEIDGYDVQTVTPLPGGQVAGEVARLRYDLVADIDGSSVSTILVDVTVADAPPSGCDALPTIFVEQRCDEIADGRWLLEGPGPLGTPAAAVIVHQDGAVLIATGQDQTVLTSELRNLVVREVDADELVTIG